MDEQMALNLAIGMMQKNRVRFQIHSNGKEVRVPNGSAAVFLKSERGNPSGRVFVVFHSPLVSGIKINARNEAKFYRWVNEANGRNRLCRLVAFDPGRPAGSKSASREVHLAMEYELLAEALREEVFMHMLRWLWMLADRFDDEVVKEFGGTRHVEPSEPSRDPKRLSETVEI